MIRAPLFFGYSGTLLRLDVARIAFGVAESGLLSGDGSRVASLVVGLRGPGRKAGSGPSQGGDLR